MPRHRQRLRVATAICAISLCAGQVLNSWMHSRGHRTNILKPDFTEMGAGFATDRAGRPYYVQIFAGPLS